MLWWHGKEHVDVVLRENAINDLHAQLSTGLLDNRPCALTYIALQNLVSVLGGTNDMKPMVWAIHIVLI